MKKAFIKTFINLWGHIFKGHPWIEAAFLSILVHIIFLNFLWFCCQIHVMMFPGLTQQRFIEIEFIK